MAGSGPLFPSHYSVGAELSEFLIGWLQTADLGNPSPGRLSSGDAWQRLRWYFSPLGEAAILLEGPVPQHGWELMAGTTGSPFARTGPGTRRCGLGGCHRWAVAENCRDSGCPVHGSAGFPFVAGCLHREARESNPRLATPGQRRGRGLMLPTDCARTPWRWLSRAIVSASPWRWWRAATRP